MKLIPKFIAAAYCAFMLTRAMSAQTGLTLHLVKDSPQDLAISGKIKGLPPGETRYIRWSQLRALPSRELVMTDQVMQGKHTLVIVMLDDVLRAIPVAAEADALIATCNDGYASIYSSEFVAQYKPFFVLEINGRKPDQWPPEGMTFNPGPYVISIADEVAPGSGQLLDAGHKRPWGVDALEIIAYNERFAPIYTGALKTPASLAHEGRNIWINSCFSCHQVIPSNLGGIKAGRPIQVVAAQAAFNPDYFKKYVREPQKVNPSAKMEPHPHYTDAQLDALIAFLKLTINQEVP